MDLYLIRHTKVDVEPGVCYGQSDVGLAATFEADLNKVKTLLDRHILPEKLQFISSPAKRCQLLVQHLSPDSTFAPELWEMNFGAWEGRTWGEIPQTELDAWMADFVNIRPPGGENFLEVQSRSVKFLQTIVQNNVENLALITHAGVIRGLLCHLINLPLSNAFHLDLDYGSVTRLTFKHGQWKLRFHNLT
jgi:alpha-ribazole phosphatase